MIDQLALVCEACEPAPVINWPLVREAAEVTQVGQDKVFVESDRGEENVAVI